MKIRFTVFSIIASFAAGLSSQQISFSINGHIEQIDDGTTVSLLGKSGRTFATLDVDTVSDGCFRFDITTEQADDQIAMVMVNNEKQNLPGNLIYLNDGCLINISGNGYNPMNWNIESTVEAQATENAINRGIGDMTMLQRAYCAEERELRKHIRDNDLQPAMKHKLSVSLDSISSLIHDIGMAIDSIKISRMENLPVDDAWIQTFSQLASNSKFIKDYPYLETLKKLYPRITPDFLSTFDGERATAFLFPPDIIEPGEEIPDMELKTPDGRMIRLSDFRGKYVLINFWMTACAACHSYMPEMTALAGEFADRLQVMNISIDTAAMWKIGLEMLGNPPGNYLDPKGQTGLFDRFGFNGTPSFAIVSPDGTLCHKLMAGEAGSPRELIRRCLDR